MQFLVWKGVEVSGSLWYIRYNGQRKKINKDLNIALCQVSHLPYFGCVANWITTCAYEHVRPTKIQISLRIRAVWSESSSDAVWIAKDTVFPFCGQWRDSCQTLDAQACFSLRWPHLSKDRFFFSVAAQIQKILSWLSLSRLRLSRITAYLHVKTRSLFYDGSLTTGHKMLWKRREISPKEQFLLFPTIFSKYI